MGLSADYDRIRGMFQGAGAFMSKGKPGEFPPAKTGGGIKLCNGIHLEEIGQANATGDRIQVIQNENGSVRSVRFQRISKVIRFNGGNLDHLGNGQKIRCFHIREIRGRE